MKKLILTMALVAVFGIANAQENDAEAKQNQCRANASLFTEACKSKDFASAVEPWESVYRDCPDLTKNIYIYGVKIVDWQMEQAKDDKTRAALFDKLMGIYDSQIQYFGQTPEKRAVIMLKKAKSYRQYRPEDKQTYYPWLNEAVNLLQASTEPAYLMDFMQVTDEMYKADNNLAQDYIQNYTLCTGIMNQIMADSTSKRAKMCLVVRSYVDQLFAASGVADCQRMNDIFLSTINEKKDDIVYLTSILNLFKSLECKETEAYYTASTYSFNIEPTAEAAGGLGRMYFAKGDYHKCIDYLLQSIKLQEDKSDCADEYLIMAYAYNKLNNDYKVKECCKMSLQLNPKQGMPYILLANVYASAHVSDDPVLQRAVYWAAVDQLRKGREVETKQTVLDNINKLISKYSQNFPTKEQIFMHPDVNEGSTYYVGGIVGETTTVRGK